MRRIVYRTISCILLFTILLSSSFIVPRISRVQAGGLDAIIRATKISTDEAPTIDGNIDDEVWDGAAQSSSFFHFGKGTLISGGTSFKVLFTEDTLYLAIRCEQPNKPVAVLTEHDSDIYNEERVEVFFQTDWNDNNNYYQFIVNGIGTKYEGKERDRSWGGDGSGWNAAVAHHQGYWSVEIALPAELFGLDDFKDGAYGLNVCRGQLVAGTFFINSTWSPYKGMTWHEPSSFGYLAKGRNTYVDVKSTTFDIASGLITEATVVNYESNAMRIRCYQQLVDSKGGIETYSEYYDIEPGEKLDVTLHTKMTEIDSYIGTLFIQDANIGSTLYNRRLYITVESPVKIKSYWLEKNQIIASVDMQDIIKRFMPTSGTFGLYKDGALIQEKAAEFANGFWTATLSFEDYAPGEYILKTSLSDGNEIFELPDSLINKPEKPEWWDSQIGNEDIVLAPWTGIKVSENIISTWGREYYFGGSPLVSQIKSQGNDILAAPIEIKGQAGEQSFCFYETGEHYEEKSDTRVTYINTSESDEIKLEVKSTIEYDGLVRFDVNLSSENPVELQDLKVKVPIRPEFATLFDADTTDSIGQGTYPYWRGTPSGLFPEEAVGNFTPHIFVGNDEIGLVWVAESTENWSFEDENKVLALRKETDAHILEMNVVDKSIVLCEEEPLKFTFALQATPIKPEGEYPSFAMYGWYGMQNGQWIKRSSDDGRLTYPAKDYVTIESGELTVNVAPNYPVSWQIVNIPQDPRSDSQTPIVAIQFLDQSGFGLYYGFNNQTLYFEAYAGQNGCKRRHLLKEFYFNEWGSAQAHGTDDDLKDYRDVKLKWGDGQIEVWIGGEKMAEAPFNPRIFNTGIQEAQITFGSNFIYNSFSNGEKTVMCNDENVNGRILSGEFATSPSGKINLKFNPIFATPLEIFKDSDYRLVHQHEEWTESQGYPMTKTNGENFKLLASGINEVGLQYLPYIGFQLGDNTEEYRRIQEIL